MSVAVNPLWASNSASLTSQVAEKSPLARHANICLNGLQLLCSLSNEAVSRDDRTAQLGRYRIWASNIGALQDSSLRTSLEYRLREAPKLIERILELLEDIEESIEDVSQILSGERPNRSGFADGEGEDNDGKDEDPEEVTELEEIFQSLTDSISSLFKISILIRSATPRDRYAKAANSAKDSFQDQFDVSHVGHKHPKVERSENQWLRNRLGKAITQRRQYLKYCREHHDKLGDESAPSRSAAANTQVDSEIQDIPSPTQYEGRALSTIRSKPASTLAFTTASTLLPAALESAEQAMEDSRSEMSDATSMAEDSSGNQLHVIDIEKASRGMHPFECPYCFSLVRIRRQRPWRRHVFQDLKPYICTFAECDVKMFNDRNAWFTHELETHRSEYHCLFCPLLNFSSAPSFHAHLRRMHPDQVTDSQLPAITSISQRPMTRVPAKDCPLCDEWDQSLRAANPHIGEEEILTVTATQFRHHLANHLEQLALFSLPRNTDLEDEDEGSRDTNVARIAKAISISSEPFEVASNVSKEKSDPELHTAANQGVVAEVERLLRAGEDVNSLGDSWGTALHAASIAGRLSVLEILLRHGADLTALGPSGTVLQAACRGGWSDVVRFLLSEGADPNVNSGKATRNILETTSLHVSASVGNESIVQILLEGGANANAEAGDHSGIRPLHLAASKGHTNVVRILLESGADVDAPAGKESLETALEFAAAKGFVETVEVLIKAGASCLGDGLGAKALHQAAFGGHDSIIQLLIENGADVNKHTENKGYTPLDRATTSGKASAVRLLLHHAADVNSHDKDRNTPLHVAASNGSVPIVTILREANADILVRNLDGDTPLDVAIHRGRTSVVRYLLEELAALKSKPVANTAVLETAIKSGHQELVRLVLNFFPRSMLGPDGWKKAQAVYVAACAGRKDLLDILISHSFDINATNELGETALQTAASSGIVGAVKLLLEAGANVNLSTARGTALCYAAWGGHSDIVAELLHKGANIDLAVMRAAANNPAILGLLQWRNTPAPHQVRPDQETNAPDGRSPAGRDLPMNRSQSEVIPSVMLSLPDQDGYQPILVPSAGADDWQVAASVEQLGMSILNATQDDAVEHWQDAFSVVDTITNNNEVVMASAAVRIMAARLKEKSKHVQLQTLSLASVLANNCGRAMRQHLVGELFCCALTRLTCTEHTSEEVKRAVVGMLTDWLDRNDLFGADMDLKFLQSAIDTILNGVAESQANVERKTITSGPKWLVNPGAESSTDWYLDVHTALATTSTAAQADREVSNPGNPEDPFANWSGSGRHLEHFSATTNPNLLPTRESTVYYGKSYRYFTVRWKTYLLTRKTAVLDERWTRKDAFREVECLELLNHSHIMQVLGSYCIGVRFSMLLYPAVEWSLEQFLTSSAGDVPTRKRAVARFFTCLASGLDYIHSTGLRAGNIKTQSLFVARTTSHLERYKVYLTGFDLAHRPRKFSSDNSDVDEEDDENERETGASQTILLSSDTGKYAAPEESKGRSADIFSLGCVYLEMMAQISTDTKARERLHTILNSKHRDLGKASHVYRAHIPSLRTWLLTFSTNSWKGNGGPAGLNANTEMERALSGMAGRMIDPESSSRPAASEILSAVGWEHECCRSGRDQVEPDWFGANRAVRDEVLQEAEAEASVIRQESVE